MRDYPAVEKAMAILEQIQSDHVRVHLILGPAQGWAVLAALQLALRDPSFRDGPLRQLVENLAHLIQEKIAPEGPLADMAEAGWEREGD